MSEPLGALKVIRWSAWALIAAIGAVTLYLTLNPEAPKGASIGGAFSLPAVEGGRSGPATAAKDRPYAVFFGFTHCPDVCPTAMWEMSETLRKAGPAAKDFRVFFISVDPERDTAELLKTYLSAFDSRIIGIVPDAGELAQVARQHRAFYRKVPTPSGYTMDHTATIYLFDRKGELFGTFSPSDTEDSRLQKLARLLGS